MWFALLTLYREFLESIGMCLDCKYPGIDSDLFYNEEYTMKKILVCLIVIAFAISYTSSIYAADDTNQTKAKNEVNKEANKAKMTVNELPAKVKSALAFYPIPTLSLW